MDASLPEAAALEVMALELDLLSSDAKTMARQAILRAAEGPIEAQRDLEVTAEAALAVAGRASVMAAQVRHLANIAVGRGASDIEQEWLDMQAAARSLASDAARLAGQVTASAKILHAEAEGTPGAVLDRAARTLDALDLLAQRTMHAATVLAAWAQVIVTPTIEAAVHTTERLLEKVAAVLPDKTPAMPPPLWPVCDVPQGQLQDPVPRCYN